MMILALVAVALIAIIWPIFLVNNFQSKTHDVQIGLLRKEYTARCDSLATQTRQLREVVETQDKLIAVLWAKTYDYDPRNGNRAISVYGVSPPWEIWVGGHENAQVLTSRTVAFPWEG